MIKRKKLYKPQHPNCFNDGTIYQYVYVASQMLNRPLKKGEQVHHIDCNPQNNSPQNLMVFNSNSDHIKFHKYNFDQQSIEKTKDGSYIIKTDYIYDAQNHKYVCSYCGKQFYRKYCKHKNKYCSLDCYQNDKREFEEFHLKNAIHGELQPIHATFVAIHGAVKKKRF